MALREPVVSEVGALCSEGQRLLYVAKDPSGALRCYDEALAAAAGDWRGLYLSLYLEILLKIACCHRELGAHSLVVQVLAVRQKILSGNIFEARGNPWWPDRLSLVLTTERTETNPTPARIREVVLAELPPDLIAANSADLASSQWMLGDFTAASTLFETSAGAYLGAGLPEQALRQHRTYGLLALRDGQRSHLREAVRRLRHCRLALAPEDLELVLASGLSHRRNRFPRFLEYLTRAEQGVSP